ncbi:MAG: GNAT family N-acetyltransferase [Clostridiales bacterium]|nr:GNAT family N-acetyltransferase [Clostridiales bacterium]
MKQLEPARNGDADEVLALYRAAAEAGRASGRSEWDETYPTMDDIRDDLEKNGLYVLREGARVVAAISLVEPDELDGLGVSWTPARAKEASRFCLDPQMQGRGLAAEIFLSALEMLKSDGVEAVRYLCAKQNPAAFRLYTRLGHTRLEDVAWCDTEFYSFEKLL